MTQLVNSLLGIVVVPKEWSPEYALWDKSLKDFQCEGWPMWDVICDNPKPNKPKTKNLGTLVWHLRNAAAHGGFKFEGRQDSHDLQEVIFVVEDRPSDHEPINWRARVKGDCLLDFCYRLANEVSQQQSQTE